MDNPVLPVLAFGLVFGSLIWLLIYSKKRGMKNLQTFAWNHELTLTRTRPLTVEGEISGRRFQYIAGFAKRKEMFFELWRVDVKGETPCGLSIFPSAFSFYLFPANSLAKASLDEVRSRDGNCVVETGDDQFDRAFTVTCGDPVVARDYLTPMRRQTLHEVGKKGGFLYDGELFVEKEQSRLGVKVLEKHFTGLLKAAEVLDGAA